MEQLANGFSLDIPADAFPLSTDSMLLADFVRLPKNAKVLDLGSGCGTLGLLLCARDLNCQITGIELTDCAHKAAEENISANGLGSRLVSICGDFRQVTKTMRPGQFHVCVSNPPYFSGGPASQSHPAARRNDCCSTQELIEASAWALRFGGDFFLVHKPEYLAQLCACASHARLEPKVLCLVRHKPESEYNLVLLQCRKGGKPGLKIRELTLFHRDGSPTDYYKNLYRL